MEVTNEGIKLSKKIDCEYKNIAWKEVVKTCPHCPQCGEELYDVTEPNARTMVKYNCLNCDWFARG